MGIFKKIKNNVTVKLEQKTQEINEEIEESRIIFVEEYIEKVKNRKEKHTCSKALTELLLDNITPEEYKKRNMYHKKLVKKMIEDFENGKISHNQCCEIIMNDGVH